MPHFTFSRSAVLAASAALLLAFVPFVYFWEGRDPDLVLNYVYCTMTYRIEEWLFVPMIFYLWVTFMYFFYVNFQWETRRRLIITGTLHVFLHYLLGRTYWRPEIHTSILIVLLISTVLLFVFSHRWNWKLLAVFSLPGIVAFLMLTAVGGSRQEPGEVSRELLWVYAILTHWPTLVYTWWLFNAFSLPERVASLEGLDRFLMLRSNRSQVLL